MRPGLALAGLVLGLSAAPAAQASATWEDALRQHAVVTAAKPVPSGWTGDAQTCRVGTESEASQQATLSAVNAFREAAGLAPVRHEASLDDAALSAATAMHRAGALSHGIDSSWACYSPAAARGAATSNLALGWSGASAIEGYVDDSGVSSLGHRRWVLDPAGTEIGTGSTTRANALVVVGTRRAPVAAGTQVAWPPRGFAHPQWIPSRWSMTFAGGAEPSAIEVQMTVDGRPLAAGEITDLGSGFGAGRTFAWSPSLALDELRRPGHRFTVRIASGGAVLADYAVDTGSGRSMAAEPGAAEAGATAAGASAGHETRASWSVARRTTGARHPRLSGLRRGRAVAGRTVRIRLGATERRGVAAVRWYRDGRRIAGQRSLRYRVRRGDRGRRISAAVVVRSADGTKITLRSRGVRVRR